MERPKRFLATALGLFLTLSLAACSATDTKATARAENLDSQKIESENKRLLEELRRTQEKLVIKEAEVNQLKDAQEVLRKDHNLEAFPERPENYIYFPVYASTKEGDQTVLFYTAISSGTTLAEKLEILTGSISRGVFDGFPMEFLGIEEVKGRKVARIDLTDAGSLQWERSFFKNFEMGQHTQVTLIATYLQGTYRMDWVDGVSITHNGSVIDHPNLPGLAEAIFRNEPRTLQ